MAANAAAAALEKRKEKALNDVVAQLEAKFLDGVFSGADVDEILTKAKIHLDAAKAAARRHPSGAGRPWWKGRAGGPP